VAAEQRYRGYYEPFGPWYAPRDPTVSPQGLGEPRSSKSAVEKGRTVRQSVHKNKCVFFCIHLGLFVHCYSCIRVEKQLLETIALQIQRLKPDNVPKPPYTFPSPKPIPQAPPPKSSAAKGKRAVKPKPPPKPAHRPLPVPPDPQPPLTTRISAYSPALPSGVLIETIKAGMNAQQENAAGGVPMPGGAGGGKGKRKVVRVRG
jgi:hypothetical protein